MPRPVPRTYTKAGDLGGNDTSRTILPHATWVTGDAVFVWGDAVNNTAITPPAGWTTVFSTSPNTSFVMACFAKTTAYNSATDGAGWDFTVLTNSRFQLVANAYGGANVSGAGTSYEAAQASSSGAPADTNIPTPTSDSITNVDDYIVSAWAARWSAKDGPMAITAPASHFAGEQSASDVAGTTIPQSSLRVAGLQSQPVALGTFGPYTATVTDTPQAEAGGVFAVKPASGVGPTVSAGPDLTVNTGSANFVITGTTTPVSPATITSRLWTVVSGVAVTLANTTTVAVTVTPPATTGTTVLRLSATDSNGLTTTDDVTITWVAPGRVLSLTADVTTVGLTTVPVVAAGQSFTLLNETSASAVGRVIDPTPSGVEYRWRLAPAPPPGVTDGVILSVMAWVEAGTVTQSVRFRLYDSDGTTVRKSVTYTTLPAYTEAQITAGLTDPQILAAKFDITLTSGEAALITGWATGLVVGWAATVT